MVTLCDVTKHCHATTRHYGDQFWSMVFEIFLLFMKELVIVKLGIYRFTLWYGNWNSRTLISKENYILTFLTLIVRFAMQGL
jgi:hypothetical protein